jgi:FG-GAP repeat
MKTKLILLVLVTFAPVAQSQDLACEFAKLTPVNAEPNQRFGRSVALSGDVLVVGAPEMVGGLAVGFGSAYVHRWDGIQWRFEQQLTAADGALQDSFGLHVSVTGDTILFGAPLHDDFGDGSGAVYVFEFVGNEWVQTQKLVASDATGGEIFGISTLVGDDIVFVGANGAVNSGNTGAVYVFERRNEAWEEVQKIAEDAGPTNNLFGASIDYLGDRLIVGAVNGNNTCGPFDFCGSAFVYVNVGGQWVQEQEFLSAAPMNTDIFGSSVALLEDWAFVGARGRDDVAVNGGAVDVFRWINDAWQFHETLAPKGLAQDDTFGQRIVATDGLLFVTAGRSNVACPMADPNCDTGAVYVYEFDGTDWGEHDVIVPTDPTGELGFGISLSIDAGRLAIGAWNDDEAAENAGATYVFQLNPPSPGNGDADFDNDVDFFDYARFQRCFDAQIASTCCIVFDFDDDGDVDLLDHASYLDTVTGP